jgi:transcription antitermination protein NusB
VASRRRARTFAMQALYMADLREESAATCLNDLWSMLMDDEGVEGERPPESAEVEFASRLARGAEDSRDELDSLIEQCSTNWRLPRMPVVDRNILRMAAFELKSCADIPASVSINEAVELAKTYGGGDSRAFVNGIVDRLGRLLGRIEKRG